MENREEWIQRRAYALWEQAGRPVGKDVEHWQQANLERDALERSAASVDGGEVTTRIRDRLALVVTASRKPPMDRVRLRKSA
ncbi:DUF2934 domain-containing protein [Oryzifoliimicrobium ureilyticus]|uniref:DUF2934 domain-containing protein n=1 Tax=Oryzifoliimicrobium ureilyticus TaxID=3113724 RepID=UPI003075FDC3